MGGRFQIGGNLWMFSSENPIFGRISANALFYPLGFFFDILPLRRRKTDLKFENDQILVQNDWTKLA